MITRASNLVVVEGNMAPSARGEPHPPKLAELRRRVEIDIETGLVSAVSEPRGTGDLVLPDDYLILAGAIDCHVHAREDATGRESYKECFQSAGEAALHGGVTAFADMPNNPRPPVDDDSYREKRRLSSRCFADVLLFAGIGPHTRPLSFPAPYKVYMGPSVGELFFEDEDSLRQALSRYRGQVVAFHAERPEVLARCSNAPTHESRRPPEAEVAAIDLALRLAENYHLEPHICHLSTAEGLRLIREARSRGLGVTCEVTPHHLFYDLDNAANFAHPRYLQCNPPLRSRLDRIELLRGLRSGEIDMLASDHAPHTIEEKERGTSGLPHLDTFGPFLFWLLDEGFDLATIQRVSAEVPGRFLSRFLPQRYGRISEGFVGSLTILRRGPATIRRSDLRTRAGWSPFEGCTFSGRVSHTIVRGRIYPEDL